MALDIFDRRRLGSGDHHPGSRVGHFIVARLCGRARGCIFHRFGPRLFGWKRGATDWRVSALPLGGYVRMAGQDLSMSIPTMSPQRSVR